MSPLSNSVPLGPNGLMNADALKQWVLRRLGAPVVKVELTQDDLDDAVENARRWFSAKKGFKAWTTMQMVNQDQYLLPDYIDTVIEITFTNSNLDIQRFVDPLALVDGLVPANVLGAGLGGMGGWGGGGGMLSAYAQTVQYLRTAREVLSADYDWLQRGRYLTITPNISASGYMLIEYKAASVTVEQLNERDHDLLKRWCLADAREKLGTVRSKFDSFPGAQGPVVIDGQAQLQRALDDKMALDEELAQSGFPLGIMVG